MKPILQIVLFLGLAAPSFSAMPLVDFEGKNTERHSLASFFDDMSLEVAVASSKPVEEYELVRKPGIIDENGEFTPLEPIKRWRGDDGIVRTEYQYWPTQKISWWLECKGTSQPTWTAKETYTFTSDQDAGHLHYEPAQPPIKESKVYDTEVAAPADGEFYPRPSPFYFPTMPVNARKYYWERMPVFAATLVEEFQSFGACTKTQIDIIKVKVPNLVELKAGSGYELSGKTAEHPYNHYVTSEFAAQLMAIGGTWKEACPKSKPLVYNDMSLPWGGKFDLALGWGVNPKEPHAGHNYGNNADVSKWRVRKGNRAKLVKMMCEYAHVYTEGDGAGESPHYHLAYRASRHADDIPDFLDSRYQYCCPAPMPEVPQVCIDLQNGGTIQPEDPNVPVETDCP